jgi:hypothetical protein
MKVFLVLSLALLAGQAVAGDNPIRSVLELLAKLQGEVIKEGEDSQKVYDKFAEACEDRSGELHREIKAGEKQVDILSAAIEQNADRVDEVSTKIEEISSKTSNDEADLKAATHIRKTEKTQFSTTEKEMMDTIDTLKRAVGVIEKQGASLLQAQAESGQAVSGAQAVVRTLSLMVEASSLDTVSAQKLTALLQASDDSADQMTDGSDAAAAPDASNYESHSSGLVETLEDLQDKAELQLQDARKAEKSAQASFELMKQSLEDKIKFASAELQKAKKEKGEAGELKATAEGSLSVTKTDMAKNVDDLGALHRDCMQRASGFEEEVLSRSVELKALAQAKKVVAETTGAAEQRTYSAVQESEAADESSSFAWSSFLQVKQQRAGQGVSDRVIRQGVEALKKVRKLARQQKSKALLQLAHRIEGSLRASGGHRAEDVFEKVKGLLADMVAKLTKEAEDEAAQKSFCDKELAESNEKQEDKSEFVDKLSTKIDTMSSRVTALLEEIADVQSGLAELAASQAGMDKLRLEQKALFETAKVELDEGIKGLRLALKVLRDYYSKSDDANHEAAEGSGNSIISILEVAESDFTKGLMDAQADEEASATQYEQLTQENNILVKEKQQAVKYETKDLKSLQKTITEYSSDRDTAQTELDAIEDYLAKLKGQCIAKAEPYEERKKKREKEMAGLSEALDALTAQSEEASLLQLSAVVTPHSSHSRQQTSLRGA